MPDLINVFFRRWKLIAGLTLAATLIALIISLASPKEYLSVATALPANSLIADRARIFNDKVQGLYSDFGTSDELDKIEGTAALDTIYIAAAEEFDLPAHYHIASSGEATYKAALELKNDSRVNRTGYGELKVHVWDKDRNLAAALANSLLQKIQLLLQHLQAQNNELAAQKIKEEYNNKEAQYRLLADSSQELTGAGAEIAGAKKAALMDQLKEYKILMDQYQLSLQTNPQVLFTVENARPSFWPDRPKVMQAVLLTLFASFVFSFLLALFVESRKVTS